MAKKISVGIDIGSNIVKIVQIRKDKRGVELEKYVIAEITDKNPVEVVKSILKREGINQKNVVTVISGVASVIRFITMPIMDEKGLKHALHWGGVSEYIPFDLKDFVWDVSITKWYRRQDELAAGEKPRMDVLLVIARKDLIREHLSMFNNLKIKPTVIDVGAISLINFTCYNSRPSETLYWGIIDIGARSAGVNILEAETFRFNFEVPFGVDVLVNAVKEKLGINTKEANEIINGIDLLKIDNIEVAADETERQLLHICDDKLRDLVREINGAIKFQESKTPNKTISKLFLSGGGSKIKNIDKFLSKRLNREVVLENKLNPIAINYGKKDEEVLNKDLPLINVAIGAALRGLVKPKTNINLLPVEEVLGRKLQIQKIIVGLFYSFIISLMLFLAFVKFNKFISINKEASTIGGKISSMRQTSEELIKMNDSLDKLNALISNIGITKSLNKSWANSLSELTNCVPNGMWLERFDGIPRGGITISGKVGKGKMDLIESFMKNCATSNNFKGIGLKDFVDSEEYLNFNAGRREESLTQTKQEEHIP